MRGILEQVKSSWRSCVRGSSVKAGLGWAWKDMRKSHLLWVKVIFLFQSASLVVLYPYLTIHMRSLGFSIEEAGIVNSAVPLADVFGPPLAGLVADKIGNFGIFMSVTTFLNGAASLMLLAAHRVKLDVEVSCCRDGDVNDTELQCTITELEELGVPLPAHNELPKELEATCPDLRQRNETSVTFFVAGANETLLCDNWDHAFVCKTTIPNPATNWIKAFSGYLVIRIILDILRASSLMLFEGAVVVIIKEHGGDYGLQKLFGTVGAVTFGPLAGVSIDLMSKYLGKEDYSSVIVLYFVLRAITSILVLKLSLSFKPPAKKVLRDLSSVLCQFKVLTYLVAFVLTGILWGFLETFLFWFLEDLQSTKFLMGISLAVGTLAGLPLTVCSRLLINKLGYQMIMVIALALYALRLCGYSLIPRAEYALIFELLKPFCTTLLLITAMNFVKDVSPMSTAATLEGIFGSLYFGVGRGMGGLLGAYSWEAFGARRSFQVFATLATLGGIAFNLLHCAASKMEGPASDPEEVKDKTGQVGLPGQTEKASPA